MDTLQTLREDAHRREGEALLDALRGAAWSLTGAADLLYCAVSSLQRALARHPEIDAERKRRLAAGRAGAVAAAYRATQVRNAVRTDKPTETL
jgi:hypothetical protein